MINSCRQKGVRIYTNAVIDHMAGDGNDMYLDHRINVDSCIHCMVDYRLAISK